MPSSATATVTGKIGPGNTLTAAVYSGITSYSFNPVTGIFTYSLDGIVHQIDIAAATTVTIVLSAALGNHTVTIS